MGRVAALLLFLLALVPAGCRQQPEGSVKVVVIGGEPRLRDPTLGPLSAPDEVLLQNVAQGLVRFDPAGNIVAGLAERWNVSDDGLSYIFRLASSQWPDGRKITADQVAKLLKREISPRSRNSLKDSLGAVDDIVAMTDRVIEIRLAAPRPNLLSLLAQPQFAVLRGGMGTGPFKLAADGSQGAVRLSRDIVSADDESTSREEVLLAAGSADDAIAGFVAAKSDLVLGGTFDDLPGAQRARLPRGSLHFDPASGLFGLVPAHADGPLSDPEVRALLSQAIDRDALIAAFAVPGLAARATLLEPGLDGMAAPIQPAWAGTPLEQRRAALAASVARLFPDKDKRTVKLLLPEGPGGDLLFGRLAADWSAIGLTVERASAASADLELVDKVAPSASPAWFIRQFRCSAVALCDKLADTLLDAAREAVVPAQRYALLSQAAARIDDGTLFIPIAAPVRWSLVSSRIENFAGNRYARHTLTGLEDKPGAGD